MWKFFSYALLFILVAVFVKPAQAQMAGTDWTGTFYNDTTLTTSVASENYPHGLYFNWGTGPARQADNATPVPGVNSDDFSASFTSTQTFAQGGIYTFSVYVDDGVRVYLDDAIVLDQFDANPGPNYRVFTFQHMIAAGDEIDIRVDYVEFTGNAVLVFQWGMIPIPDSIEVYSPLGGTTFSDDVTPLFSWQDIGAPSYVFKLWSADRTSVLQKPYPAASICAASVCTLDLGALPGGGALALKNGLYAWRVNSRDLPEIKTTGAVDFVVSYPGMPFDLTPNLATTIVDSSPVLQWGDVEAADQYKVVLIRQKTGQRIKTGWLTDISLGCDASGCTLDLAAMQPPVVLKRGKYKWHVLARNTANKANVSKSPAAFFKVVPENRSSPAPVPEAVDGFRAP